MSDDEKGAKREGMSIGRIMDLSRGFQASRIFLTAYELDVFTTLGEGGMSSEEAARAIGADPRGMDRLLNALCGLELVTKSDGKFRNSAAAAQFLVKGKPGHQSGLMHTVHLWHSWGTLTEAVRKGGLVRERPVDERDESWLGAFIEAMHSRATNEAPRLVAELDLTGVSRVLDVGGGSGVFSMAFVRAGENIKATVFDLPNVVPLTKGYVDKEGLGDRIDSVAGNYNKDELPSGYDLAFLSAIIHSNSPEQNQALFGKVSRALNPGGRIVVSDFVMDEDRSGPVFGVFFALNMLVNTPLGDTYTESEISGWMTDAGMSFVERRDLGATGLMIGRKG